MEFNVYEVTKKGVFSPVYDVFQNGESVAIGENNSLFSSTIYIRDTSGNLIYSLKKDSIFSTGYYFEKDEYTYGRISKAAFSNKYMISSDFGIFEAIGNMWSSSFTIIDKNSEEEIAKISKKSKAFSNSTYGIAVNGLYDSFFFVAVLIAMIKIMQAQKQS